MTSVEGIDVSADQGEFDWAPHKDIDFAGLRTTTWTGTASFNHDPQLERNAAATWALKGAGRIPRIYYHETRPGVTSAKVQARQFRDALGGHLCEGDLLAAAMESAEGEPPSFVAAWHRDFLTALNGLAPGARVLAYCNPSWAQEGNAAGLDRWHLWLADYGISFPQTPRPWKKFAFWQYDGTTLDRDVWSGDLASLLDFARMPAWRRA
jgi:GH25 family lysozyme M1 (1,4-beta-N-acetylmuramidase)